MYDLSLDQIVLAVQTLIINVRGMEKIDPFEALKTGSVKSLSFPFAKRAYDGYVHLVKFFTSNLNVI
ncbi:hypothetical protein AKJ18_09830 [Vibrio xuii]|nr:hypothetical protein AKJ18_09830 [Vibrio xuii]